MVFYIELHDSDGVVHKYLQFTASTLDQLREQSCLVTNIDEKFQQLFSETGDELVGPGKTSLQSLGLKDGSKVILKHSKLLLWDEYKKCVNLALVKEKNKVDNAKQAVKNFQLLMKSGFFTTYLKFNDIWKGNHAKLIRWADESVVMRRDATENYFLNLHDQKRENKYSSFICTFKERISVYECAPIDVYASVKIHGEDSVTSYNIRCHSIDPQGIRSSREPELPELYCYKLLSLIDVVPKTHIIPPSAWYGSETKTSTYIAIQLGKEYEIVEDINLRERLSGDVIVQLVLLDVLLSFADLNNYNCGTWEGTEDAAIVFVELTEEFEIYSDIKKEFLRIVRIWERINGKVSKEHDDMYWLNLARKYLDKWDLPRKIEMAREQLDPTGVLLDCFARHINNLNEYIDTLNQNLENLQVVLNTIV